MSYLKHTANLFLGVAELNRLSKFLDDDGFRQLLLKISGSFGIVRYESDSMFKNFKAEEDVTGSGNIKFTEDSFAIDSEGKFIRLLATSGIAIPNDSNWYWLKIAHDYSVLESGTVSVDSSGNLTGVGTKFTEVLRGAPHFPSKISFSNASANTLEYQVVEVISDTSAILNGSFTSETDLTYRVVGTFTPGKVPSPSDKYPFQYDSCSLTQEPEVTLNTAPSKTDGLEFFVARVRNVGGNVTIEDKRTEFYKEQGHYSLTNIVKDANPLIGVESIKYSHTSTARDENQIYIGWGVRSSVWTSDIQNKSITFSGNISAGKYKTTSQFSNDELNGWRIYFKDGSFEEVHDTVKVGSDIRLLLKSLDPDKITSGDELTVVPAVDEVEIQAIGTNNTIKVVSKNKSFPASDGFGIVEVPVPSDGYLYVVKYRYHKNGEASQFLTLPTDTTNGFYNENQFDDNGDLVVSPVRTTYTASDPVGFIPVKLTTTSFSNFVGSVVTGDKFGVDIIQLDNLNNKLKFTVGSNKMVQVITGLVSGAMNVDHILGLDNTGAKAGNSFTFIFEGGINDASTYQIDINTGYVSSGSPGSSILTLEPEHLDFPYLTGKRTVVKCIFDGTNWRHYIEQEDSYRIDDVKFAANVTLGDFTVGKANLGTKHQGWAICDGSNGTIDLKGKFVVGYDSSDTDYDNQGDSGGAKTVTLSTSQIPSHTHSISSDGSHTHQLSTGHDFGGGPFSGGPSDVIVDGSGFSGSMGTSSDGAHNHGGATGSAGTGGSHENRPPFYTVVYLQRIRQS